MTTAEKAKLIVNDSIEELENRGGFDGWWGSIDEDIQKEIKETLERLVIKSLS